MSRQENWEHWLARPVKQPPVVHLAFSESRAWLSIGQQLWGWFSGRWQQVDDFAEPIRQICYGDAAEALYLLVGQQIL